MKAGLRIWLSSVMRSHRGTARNRFQLEVWWLRAVPEGHRGRCRVLPGARVDRRPRRRRPRRPASTSRRSARQILDHKESMAFDWAWEEGTHRDQREFKIVQSSPSIFWQGRFDDAPFRTWAVEFATALMGMDLQFWYDQFLAKPPHKSVRHPVAPGRGLLGPQPRRPRDHLLDAVPRRRRVERVHALHRRRPPRRRAPAPRTPPRSQATSSSASPDESRAVAVPISVGGVTFHHSKTPHMTTPNVTGAWRRILTQHLCAVGCAEEGDHYPWKVTVNQVTGEVDDPGVPVTDPRRGPRGRAGRARPDRARGPGRPRRASTAPARRSSACSPCAAASW